MPRYTVKLFAMAREKIGRDEVEVSSEGALTAAALKTRLGEQFPDFARLVQACRLSQNLQFCRGEEALAEGDELALIPPVSGGSTVVEITRDPIRLEKYAAMLEDPSCGAQAFFTGTVRDNHQGQTVKSIQYEAYEDMALAQMHVVAREIEEQFKDVKQMVLVHRFGHLHVGEIAVLVGIASGHRDECFKACRHGIDRIKDLVTIWKKEFFPDGTAWVGSQSL